MIIITNIMIEIDIMINNYTIITINEEEIFIIEEEEGKI